MHEKSNADAEEVAKDLDEQMGLATRWGCIDFFTLSDAGLVGLWSTLPNMAGGETSWRECGSYSWR